MSITPEHEHVLKVLDDVIQKIAGDYPNATVEYKRSSFVQGAVDMAMGFVDFIEYTGKYRIQFARRVNQIRLKHFPE